MERASASMHWQGPHSKRGALAQTPPRPSPPRFNERREPAANKLRATSHTSEEPWPRNCESPKQSVQRPSQHTSKLMSCGHESSCVVWSRIWRGPLTKCYFNEFYSCKVSRIIKKNWTNQRLWAFGVPWSFGVVLGLSPRGGFLKIVQVTMKHDPFDAMRESMWTLHPSCTHLCTPWVPQT